LPSPTVEQYLQSICKLGGSEERVQLKAVAEDLSVSPASVTEMAGRLDDQGLCVYEPYKGVRLTKRGRREALKLLRNHRLWERFLSDVLHLPWDTVHVEAHRLEHATSDLVAERLAVFLNNPETCPHGMPLPGPDGEMPADTGVPLAELGPGRSGRVLRVARETGPLLSHLQNLGLFPGVLVTVQEVDPFDGVLLVAVGDRNTAVGRTVAETVVVSPIPSASDRPEGGVPSES